MSNRIIAALARQAESIIFHSRTKEENNIDPDDGNSWICSACKLPIFSTPFKSYSINNNTSTVVYLHDQCAQLPPDLLNCDLHYAALKPLVREANADYQATTCTRCVKCKATCGIMLYRCADPRCSFRLDVLCALTIRILHRSHEHRLMVIRSGPATFICSACGTSHDQATSELVYLCSACCFWIHPHCASLPNAIQHDHHRHPLLLNYGHPDSSMRPQDPSSDCAICGDIIKSWGLYSCAKCRYYVHIMCAVSHPQTFNRVLIREARLPDLVHLPIPNEYTSLIRRITDSAISDRTSNSSSSDHPHSQQ